MAQFCYFPDGYGALWRLEKEAMVPGTESNYRFNLLKTKIRIFLIQIGTLRNTLRF